MRDEGTSKEGVNVEEKGHKALARGVETKGGREKGWMEVEAGIGKSLKRSVTLAQKWGTLA